jgi:CubicO group peptidase (beta-lactamase class C family)
VGPEATRKLRSRDQTQDFQTAFGVASMKKQMTMATVVMALTFLVGANYAFAKG